MIRRTVIVDGPLAFRMRRIAAAHAGEMGLQIATLPQLAARLAGGFVRPARTTDLDPAIRAALDIGGFADIDRMRQLPGATRAIARTLGKLWRADLCLADRAGPSSRLADIAEVDNRVRAHLPAGVLTPRDLRDAALVRLGFARTVLGSVELEGVAGVAQVWRPLLVRLAETVDVSWRNPGVRDTEWFVGKVVVELPGTPAPWTSLSCANPRTEAVEALRWARELIATRRARPNEIAICSASTEEWDDHFLVLARDADLPLHFSHGLPALASRAGQSCAALADVLLNGPSQERVRRLFAQGMGRSDAMRELPTNWALGLKRGAALFDIEHWRRALEEAMNRRPDKFDVRPIVIPILQRLITGLDTAPELEGLLPSRTAREIWKEALRRAPAKALEFSLEEVRLPDRRDPAASIVWCPASHLAAAPRRFVRLLGMTTRTWPRRDSEDPLLPDHLLPAALLDPDPVDEQDRRAFRIVTAHASGECVLTRSRRNPQGGLLAPSPLVSREVLVSRLEMSRVPEHAFSPSDRLLARPQEALNAPGVASADVCWRDWMRTKVTAHDGLTRPGHPAIVSAIGRVQSATSLRSMLRDPLGFVWRYALGWQSVPDDDQPLEIDARAFGELVHELLRRAVDALEPTPGFSRAQRNEIEAAIAAAARDVGMRWPLERAVPPRLLWQHTLDAASRLATNAVCFDDTLPDTRSWTEVPFGRADAGEESTDHPWPPNGKVVIVGTEISLQGEIDRLDLRRDRAGVRVSDYKTGMEPKDPAHIVLGRGAELQRAVYALAVRQLLPDCQRVVARLLFLNAQGATEYRLPDVDRAIADLATHVRAAVDSLRKGNSLPGPDATQDWNEFKLALPAHLVSYYATKAPAVNKALGDATRAWKSP